MIDCDKVLANLDAYLDGELKPAAYRQIEEHLSGCSACAHQLEIKQNIVQSFKTIGLAELPAGFSKDLHNSLVTEPKPKAPAIYRRNWFKGLAGAACLLLLIGVVGGALGLGSSLLSSNNYDYAESVTDESGSQMAYDSASYDMMSAEAPMAAPEMMMEEAVEEGMVMADMAAPDMAASGAGLDNGSRQAAAPQEQLERKIIHDANFMLAVENFSEAYLTITDLAEQMGGYVSSADTYSDAETGQMVGGYISIYVDANLLDQATELISGLGIVEHQYLYSEDITMMYYDIAGRLEQYQAQEQRLLEILAQAVTVEDLIVIESEMMRIRAEIESLSGQINYYDQVTSLSKINIDMYQPDPDNSRVDLDGWAGFVQDMEEAFFRGINGLIDMAALMITGFISLLPILIVLAIIIMVLVIIIKRRLRR